MADTKLEQVLLDMKARFGLSVFKQKQKFVSVFGDLAPDCTKEKQILGTAIEMGVPGLFENATQKDADIVRGRVRRKLEDLMRDEAIELVFRSFAVVYWEEKEENKLEKKITEGTYCIISSISSSHDYVMDCEQESTENGARIMLWNNRIPASNQRIRVILRSDGFYELEFVHSGKLIDVAGGDMNSKAKVIQWERNGHHNQHWSIVPAETGDSFYIIARHSKKYLSSQHYNSTLLACTHTPQHFGAELTVYSNHQGSNQRWKFVPTPDSVPIEQQPIRKPVQLPVPKPAPASNDFEINDGVLVKYHGYDRDVMIPEGINEIGFRAFEKCSFLCHVHIPDGVTIIGDEAFCKCESGLTSIHIPEGVIRIGHSAFFSCHRLTSVHIPEGVTEINVATFANCYNLKSVYIPNGVTSIGRSAFADCTSLTSIHIPKGVIRIEESAFWRCRSLDNLTLPESVQYIGERVFVDCPNLNLILPKHLKPKNPFARPFSDCLSVTYY